MPSSLFGGHPGSPRPQTSPNPIQAAMQMAQSLRGSSPEQVMQTMMRSNPQFARFVEQNRGKTPEQIAKENGIDLGPVMQALK